MLTARTNSDQFISQEIFNILTFVLLGIFGLALWLLSNKLATIMVSDNDFKQGSGQGSISALEVQSIVISVLGLYFLGVVIPKFVSTII